MAENEVLITEEGLEKIESEIEYLKTVRRKEVAERIKVALGYGDLSENSEYDEAKNEQAQVEERIAKLEYMARNAKVVKGNDLNDQIVNVGSAVTVVDEDTQEEDTYYIVGSAEADPLEGKNFQRKPHRCRSHGHGHRRGGRYRRAPRQSQTQGIEDFHRIRVGGRPWRKAKRAVK